jgi:hypothetical protein
MLPSVPQVSFDDHKLELLQSFLGQFCSQLQQIRFLDGRLISSVSLASATATPVSHGLGRDIVGYFLLSKSANANVWDNLTTATDKLKFLNLSTSADCTVSLWVF